MAKLGVCSEKWQVATSTGAVTTLRDLRNAECEAFRTATSALGQYVQKRHLFEIVKLNAAAYHDCLHALASDFADDTAISWGRTNQMVLTVNCHILNFLSAMRTYLDHTETYIKREHGKASAAAEHFKTATANEFDNCMSYRFLSQLRNFTQHCGMPLGKLEMRADANSTGGGKHKQSFELWFLRDYLLTNFTGWKMVADDLNAQPPEFAVTPHIDAVIPCIERIEKVVVSDDAPRLSPHVQTLESLASEVEHLDGSPCIFFDLQPIPTGLNVNLQRIQLESIELVKRVIGDSC